jgi:hypothetical protein
MIMEALAQYEEEYADCRQIIMPEEDRKIYMPNAPWHGGYRWFRSPNVICLEKCRLLKGQVGKRG